MQGIIKRESTKYTVPKNKTIIDKDEVADTGLLLLPPRRVYKSRGENPIGIYHTYALSPLEGFSATLNTINSGEGDQNSTSKYSPILIDIII